MPKYKIYAGLGGGFGGAQEIEEKEFENEEAAEQYAYEAAKEEYESYQGVQGIPDEESIKEDHPEWSDAEIEQEIEDDMESWIDYYVELAEQRKITITDREKYMTQGMGIALHYAYSIDPQFAGMLFKELNVKV